MPVQPLAKAMSVSLALTEAGDIITTPDSA